jgi:sialate O-acetylesterase
MKRWIVLLALLSGVFSAGAAVRLPALVGDNMVLQRNSRVNVWGWASPGARVEVTTSWNDNTYPVVAAADGTWKVGVTTPQAGGPYRVTVSDGEPVVLNNVMIGEVWVASGQSNMEMLMKGFAGQPVTGANEAIARAGSYPSLRLFTVKRAQSDTPAEDCSGQWLTCTPGTAANFSAVAWFFGRELNEVLDVPVGIISTSWSGSFIEAWMDAESLRGFETPSPRGVSQTRIYNAMILPVVNYGIAGFIWYQGESNRVIPGDYAALMNRMVTLWRTKWGRGELPFYFVQIAPFIYADGAEGLSIPLVREQQTRALHQIPNTGMAVTLDAGNPTNIHPENKLLVARRLAYWALADTYGLEGISFRSPEYRSMSVESGAVTVQFDFAENGLSPWNTALPGFELAGADRVFHPAEARVATGGQHNTVVVRSAQVPDPVAVRYCFRNYQPGALYDNQGIPVAPFRSDDWPTPERF